MKRLLILGGSILQLPGIFKAIDMGIYVITLDGDSNAIGREYSNEFHHISTLDTEKILELALKIKPDGIITLASDQPMKSVAFVGQKMNLVTISNSVAKNTTNKGEMRKVLKGNNIPIPFFCTVSSLSEFLVEAPKFKLPFIVKPTDSSGSRGVTLVKSLDDLEEVYSYANKISRTSQVIIEEYLIGPEFSIEAISYKGKTNIIAITEKETSGAPYFVEMGHMIPARISEQKKKEISKIVKGTIKALKIDDGPSHCEVIYTNNGPKIVEIGARLGGDNITTHLVPLATGYDIVKETINIAVGNPLEEVVNINRMAVIKYIKSDQRGWINKIEGLEHIKSSSYFVELQIIKNMGAYIDSVKSSSDRIGYFILTGENHKEVVEESERLLSKINIEVSGDDPNVN